MSFFMRKGADVLSKWVGEAERQLRMLFEEAQRQQPAIIFFDEIDGLAPVCPRLRFLPLIPLTPGPAEAWPCSGDHRMVACSARLQVTVFDRLDWLDCRRCAAASRTRSTTAS